MPKYPKITTNKIKYKSPSGYVYIGKYIPPFEKNEKGFGFKGVILEDIKSGKIQCNICGNWYEQLQTHLVKHKINSYDYKIKYGLLISTALKTKRLRLIHSKVMSNLRAKNKSNRYEFKRNNYQANNRKDTHRGVESKNKYGVCDLQIKNKVMQLKNKMGKTPTLVDLKKEYGGTFIFHIHKRYASYLKVCDELNLTKNFSSHNPKYSREYFIEKALSNEPSIRIFTLNERRALYNYVKGGMKEIKKMVKQYKK